MNNINCEHCGSLIDTEKDIKCPNCGAPYKNNKQYKEYQEYKKRQREIELESKKLSNDIKSDIHKTTSKAIPLVFIIVFSIIVFIIIVSFFIFKEIITQTSKVDNSYNNIINNYPDEILDDYYDIFNNEDEDSYDIKVKKIVKYKETKYTNNKTYYGFYIIFENKTNSWKTLNDIYLLYSDENGKPVHAPRAIVSTDELDFFAKEVGVYEGYLYFDIPDNINDVTINYKNSNIVFNNFRNTIK